LWLFVVSGFLLETAGDTLKTLKLKERDFNLADYFLAKKQESKFVSY
jgi:hypothetical protein